MFCLFKSASIVLVGQWETVHRQSALLWMACLETWGVSIRWVTTLKRFPSDCLSAAIFTLPLFVFLLEPFIWWKLLCIIAKPIWNTRSKRSEFLFVRSERLKRWENEICWAPEKASQIEIEISHQNQNPKISKSSLSTLIRRSLDIFSAPSQGTQCAH